MQETSLLSASSVSPSYGSPIIFGEIAPDSPKSSGPLYIVELPRIFFSESTGSLHEKVFGLFVDKPTRIDKPCSVEVFKVMNGIADIICPIHQGSLGGLLVCFDERNGPGSIKVILLRCIGAPLVVPTFGLQAFSVISDHADLVFSALISQPWIL